MTEPVIHTLFPYPLTFSSIDAEFTKEELDFFDKKQEKTVKNSGNETSEDSYILNNKEMSRIFDEISEAIKFYCEKIIVLDESATPYITQSWLNYTKNGEYHHKHSHANSVLSGVFYIHAEAGKDKIVFFKDKNQTISLKTKEFNIFNAESWWLGVKTGDLLIFPSNLTHMVETTISEKTRVSLAFNVFFKGVLGNKLELTELVIQ